MPASPSAADSSNNLNQAEINQPSGSARLLAFALLLVVFYIHAGWAAPDTNEAHYLAKAKHYWNTDWCPGDFFLESDDAHLAFYWTVGPLTKLFPLPAVAWIGRLVCWSLMAWAWLRLGYVLGLRPLAAVLSGALFVTLLARCHVAGEWMIGGVEAKGLAYGFVLLGLEAMVRQRWNTVWILLGIASAFHVVVGGWTVICVAFCWCFAGADRLPLKKMLPGLFLGGAISLFGLIPGYLLTANTPPEIASEANEIYVFKRLPHHLALLRIRAETRNLFFGRFLGLTAVFALLCVFTRRSRSNTRSEQDKETTRRFIMIQHFVIGTLLIAVSGLLISAVLQNNDALAAKLMRYYWYRLSDIAVPLGVAFMSTALLVHLLRQYPKYGTALLIALLGLPLFHLGDNTLARLNDPVPRGDRSLCRVANHPQQSAQKYRDWCDACHWAKENTSPDANFLTPRAGQTFHWLAHRSQVACWKNLPQDAPAIVEWKQRVDALNPPIERDGNKVLATFAEQGADQVTKLAEQYNADYVITSPTPRLFLPVVYSNETFTIYRLDSR